MGSNATDKEKYRFGDKFVEKIIRRIAHIKMKIIPQHNDSDLKKMFKNSKITS